jgi:subtilase family serine protease
MTLTKAIVPLCALILALGSASPVAHAAQQKPILGHIDESHLVTLHGNVRPEVTAENDRGLIDDSTQLPALQLVLLRTPEAEAAAALYLKQLSDPTSPNYHKWLTNAQIGELFGPAQQDIDTITNWLKVKGFSVHSVTPDRTTIEFAGDARLIRTVFLAPIHNLSVNGVSHIANVADPQIPADLAPLVAGIASLNDFTPHKLSRNRTIPAKAALQNGVPSSTDFIAYLGPADLYAIYGFTAAFSAGYTGKGQTIALIEDTNLYSVGDWTTFRKNFGLSRAYPYGTLTQVNPTGTLTCGNPGTNSDDGEAALDVEWATAAAPNATLLNASCADSRAAIAANFGGFTALQNLLEGSSLPNVVSISYGESESEVGAAGNASINSLYESAALEGVSLFVSSGDEGAASSDADKTYAQHGITVSGFTSTPYDVSVGGTDFAATYFNQVSTYFNSTNGPNFQTAKSYVPEIPWNDSCAGQLLSNYLNTYDGTSFTPITLCNTSPYDTSSDFLTTASGSGGPSNCATGTPSVSGVAGGTCAGYAKPTWQSLLGVPSDNVRDIPDVSLMASNGFWGYYYAVCWSDPSFTSDGSGPCGANPGTWSGFGGTSVSSPIWAGIQALVNQGTSQNWGLPNSYLYSLANNEYGASGNSACNSSLGNGVASTCVFYDVTLGDMDVPCRADTSRGTVLGTFNCYLPSGDTNGLLSLSNSADEPAYGTNTGWDFATGIGTVNVKNLVTAWQTAFAPIVF